MYSYEIWKKDGLHPTTLAISIGKLGQKYKGLPYISTPGSVSQFMGVEEESREKEGK